MLNSTVNEVVAGQKRRLNIAAAIVIVVAIGLMLSWVPRSKDSPTSNTEPKVMSLRSWSTFPGARVELGRVIFTPVVRKIVNQDGTGGQADPAVNVGGQYLKFTGEFSQTVQIYKPIDASVTWRVYATPPVIYDEWRFETPSLSVGLEGDSMTTSLYDGQSETPKLRIFTITPSVDNTLSLERRGDTISITLNKVQVAKVSAAPVVSMGHWWFGVESNDTWNVSSVRATARKGGYAEFAEPRASTHQNDSSSLRVQLERTNPDKKIGAAVSLYPLMTDEKYQALAINQFSMFTTENELKAQFVHPSKGQYVFGPSDLVVGVAEKNTIAVHGHALVFGEANPSWMQQAKPTEREAIMTAHITQLVKHYQGKIVEWDVVNEPLSDRDEDYRADGLRRHIWYQAMGQDYIAKAFRAARAADPKAKLYLNDYGLEADGERWDALIVLLKKLQQQNVPIDGVGFQAHIYKEADHVERAVLTKHMIQLSALGLLSRISEIDVHGDDAEAQTEQYQTVLESCMAVSTCTSFSTWGITDKYGSTTVDHSYPVDYGNDLMLDANYSKKQAFTKISEILTTKHKQ